MPTYEYRCKDCGQELEVVQSFTDDALTTCEACGGSLRKVFGNVGIAFKGSGFYKNDSRGKSATPAAGPDKAGDAGSGTGDKSGDKAGDKGGTGTDGATPKKDAAAATTPKSDKPASTPAATT